MLVVANKGRKYERRRGFRLQERRAPLRRRFGRAVFEWR
jgi:hypothetical protein